MMIFLRCFELWSGQKFLSLFYCCLCCEISNLNNTVMVGHMATFLTSAGTGRPQVPGKIKPEKIANDNKPPKMKCKVIIFCPLNFSFPPLKLEVD